MKATERSILPSLRCAAVLTIFLLAGSSVLAQTAPLPSPGRPRMLIADVLIQGNTNVATQEIKNQLKTRPGTEFNDDTSREDVRTLMATHKFGNVEVVTQPTTDGRVIVYFLVRDYPNLILHVTYKGNNHASEDELNALHSVRPNTPLNPISNKLACQAIVRKYNDDGRPFAECHLLQGDKVGDTDVVFQITEGPKVTVKGVSFIGNTFVSGPVLGTHLDSGAPILGLFGGGYNPQMVESDIGKLIEYYKNFGFLDVRVSCEREWVTGSHEVNLIFHVQEGRRYKIKTTPHVVGTTTVPVNELEALGKVKAEDYFEKKKVDTDVKVVKDYVGYTGHPTTCEPNIIFFPDDPGFVRVDYAVQEQPVARVGQIFIVGNTRTAQNVILRQLPFYPGQILPYPDLKQAEVNLSRLGIFASSPETGVRPTVTLVDNPNDPYSEYKDVLVNVKEDNTGSLMFGVGVTSDSGLTGSIVLNERNFDITRLPRNLDDLLSGDAFRGAGEELRIEAVPGVELQRYSASIREPYLMDSLFSLTVGGYYFQRQYNEDLETRYGARVGLGRRLVEFAPEWSINTGIRAEEVNIGDVATGAPIDYTSQIGDHFIYAPSIGVTRDTRDSIIRPTEGSNVTFNYEEVLGDHVYPLVNLSANKFFTVYERADGSGRQVLVLHSQVSWAGDNTPVYDRYYAGGFSSFRGFAFRGVGPQTNGFETGGTFQFLNSVEYQVPVLANDHFYTVAFVDSGTVEQRADLNNYRVSAGFGFRFQLPMLGQVPIALDFGFPIVRASGDQTQVFSFWLGFSR